MTIKDNINSLLKKPLTMQKLNMSKLNKPKRKISLNNVISFLVTWFDYVYLAK